MHPPIRVLVRHEDAIVAAGLTHVLAAEPDISVGAVGVGASVVDALSLHKSVDVLVADYETALNTTQQLRLDGGLAISGPRSVMAVTSQQRQWEVRAALSAGVNGYILMSCPVQELVSAVRTLARGARYVCPGAAGVLAESLGLEPLTQRERDVLVLMARGRTNRLIASELAIGIGTVKSHVQRILEKLPARTRAHAVAVATELGLAMDS